MCCLPWAVPWLAMWVYSDKYNVSQLGSSILSKNFIVNGNDETVLDSGSIFKLDAHGAG